MALRNLVAKMRNPVAAALRPPSPAPRAGARPKFYSSAQGGGPYRLKINIQSASQEELLREAQSVRREIDEIWELVSKETEKIPRVEKKLWRTGKLVICSGILASIISYATHEEDEPSEDGPTAESED